ncbi:hypothetical protein GCM10009809_40410 [Isoptericola hypogeus]|uniref:YdbS-like PH domain-containing protein n=1 Tax=Isoptericola hypogeus TaxID=300179 RepID=A0ABN2JVW1_9MICO
MPAAESRVRDAVVAHRHLRRYVLPHEHVVVATRRHWARLLEPIATTVAAFLLIGAIVMSTPVDVRDTVQWLWVLWFVAAGRLAWLWLEWRYEWFVATDKRLLLLYGLVVHRVAMMPLKKVTDMGYSRSPVGQVLGYGRFDMESAGQDQALRTIRYVPHPDATYRTLCDTIFTPGHRDDDDDLPGPPSTVVVPGRRGSDDAGTGDGGEPRPTTQPIKLRPAVPSPRPDDHAAIRTKGPGPRYEPPASDGAGPYVPEPFL